MSEQTETPQTRSTEQDELNYQAKIARQISGAPKLHISERGKTALYGGLAIASIGVAAISLNSMEGGSSHNEKGEIDPSITSITLADDVNVRFDPYVADAENNNLALHLVDHPITITNPNTLVLNDTDDGTWYGLSASYFENPNVLPDVDFKSSTDKDGIVWINEQGISKVEHSEEPTE